MLVYVPAVIPISERGFPRILETIIVFSELVIFICLSDLTANAVDIVNTCAFKSDTIVSVASIATVVVAKPNLLIAPEVTSTISKLWFVLDILSVPVTTDAVTPEIDLALICVATLSIVGFWLVSYVPAVMPNSLNAVPEITIELPELTIVIRLLESIVAVISDIAVKSVAKLSNLESVYEFVVDSPKSINDPPVIVNCGNEVVKTNWFEDVDATTWLVPVLIAVTIAVKSSPLVSEIVSPLIVNGFVDVIVGEVTVPVTVKSATVFVVASIITVLPVVSEELLVAVVVSDIVLDWL